MFLFILKLTWKCLLMIGFLLFIYFWFNWMCSWLGYLAPRRRCESFFRWSTSEAATPTWHLRNTNTMYLLCIQFSIYHQSYFKKINVTKKVGNFYPPALNFYFTFVWESVQCKCKVRNHIMKVEITSKRE